MKTYRLLFLMLLLAGCFSVIAQSKSKYRFKKPHYEEVDFEEMMRRYFGKGAGTPDAMEGIYSVSCVITKQGKNIFGEDKVRVLDRKDNYARVAILKDWPGSKRDYIEVSLSYRTTNKYPVMGEISGLAEGGGFIYKHFEPDGSSMSFSMAADAPDVVEGEYSESHGRKIITYKLSYLKIYPKSHEMAAYNH